MKQSLISEHVNYSFEISNIYDIDKIHNKIQNILTELEYNIVFIAYNNTHLKITFKNNLTDEQENLLMNILLKYIKEN
jgi:uncharacterized protein YutD